MMLVPVPPVGTGLCWALQSKTDGWLPQSSRCELWTDPCIPIIEAGTGERESEGGGNVLYLLLSHPRGTMGSPHPKNLLYSFGSPSSLHCLRNRKGWLYCCPKGKLTDGDDLFCSYCLSLLSINSFSQHILTTLFSLTEWSWHSLPIETHTQTVLPQVSMACTEIIFPCKVTLLLLPAEFHWNQFPVTSRILQCCWSPQSNSLWNSFPQDFAF